METNVSKTINQTEEVVINETLELINITINQTTNETVEEQNQTQEIEIKLEYNSGTNFDPDDNGIEDIDSAIDFIIKEATFNFKLNESNLCSKWDVYSQENKESTILCHGDDECCNFIGVMPFQEDWNDIFYLSYERHGATLNNIVSAQVIYFDYDDTQTSLDIKYSLPASLKAIFKPHFVEFEDICLETCRLEDVGRRPYKLIFELENGSSINIEEITYSMILVNKPPVFSHIPNQKLTKDGIITIDRGT